MKTSFVVVLLAILCGVSLAQDQQTPVKRHVAGCVTSGVEAGCLIIADKHSGKKYELRNGSVCKPPAADGMAFDVVGVDDHTPGTCMQGPAIKATKCSQIRMECPKSEGKGQ